MNLIDKRIAFLGDSITEGVGASSIKKRYTEVFKELSGAEVLNFGVSGTTYGLRIYDASVQPIRRDFIARFKDLPPELDVLVIFGGTNDWEVPLGVWGDNTDETFYGACKVLYEKAINRYPMAEIVVVTPLRRDTQYDHYTRGGKPCAILSEYVNAIRRTADYYSLPLLDLYKNSGIQPEVEIIKKVYLPDGLHPSDEGHRRIAERIYGFLKSI